MERAIAVKKLGKMLGKGFGYRVDPRAPDADEREEARVECKSAVALRNDLEAKMNARRQAVLAVDAEYQTLRENYTAARKRTEQLSSQSHRYRFTVGVTICDHFFSVKAQGDSWEEVIAKVSGKVDESRPA